MKHKRLTAAAAAIALVIVAAVLFHPGRYLVLRDGGTGRLIARFPVEEGDRFAVGFIHSVNLNPLVDLYEIHGRTMCARECIYYAFGAGVQTDLNEGETLSFGEDGAIIVSNIDKSFDKIEYSVGVWSSDRTLMLGDIHPVYLQLRDRIGVFTEGEQADIRIGDVRMLSLSALCGRGCMITLTCEDMLLPF